MLNNINTNPTNLFQLRQVCNQIIMSHPHLKKDADKIYDSAWYNHNIVDIDLGYALRDASKDLESLISRA